MADPAEDEDQDQAPKKNWRKELEDRANTAESALVDASQELAFYKAGLGGLSDEQRTDVLTLAKARGQTTADDLKAIADRLSYASQPAAPAPTETAEPEVDAVRKAELAQLRGFAGGALPPTAPLAGEAETLAKIRDFDSPESLKEWVLANPDLFGDGSI